MKKIYWLISLLFLNSCSLFFASDGTPEAQQTVLSVSDKYLRFIVRGDVNAINSYVLWDDYEASTGIEKSVFVNLVRTAHKDTSRWTNETHPLLGLKLAHMRVKDNDADLELHKPSAKDKIIKLHLKWNGSAWLITKDNIFTDNGILTR